MAAKRECPGQKPCLSAGCPQKIVSYESESELMYPHDSQPAGGDIRNEDKVLGNPQQGTFSPHLVASVNSEGLYSGIGKASIDPYYAKPLWSTASSNCSGQATKSLYKAPIQLIGSSRYYRCGDEIPSLSGQGQVRSFHRNSLTKSRPISQVASSNGHFRMGEKINSCRNYEVPIELTHASKASRGKSSLTLSSEKDDSSLSTCRGISSLSSQGEGRHFHGNSLTNSMPICQVTSSNDCYRMGEKMNSCRNYEVPVEIVDAPLACRGKSSLKLSAEKDDANHSTCRRISSLSSQGQVRHFHGNDLTKSTPISQGASSNDQFRMGETSNSCRNYQASIELVRGPRSSRGKSSSTLSATKDDVNKSTCTGQYNQPDFPIKYEQAKFFMIKSFSEDDIHNSIKYNVWASTSNGNKKLDAAFQEAQMVMKDKGAKCPIFLFFSVNASGQFIGLAEMIGPVDFKKSMDFWRQGRWNGFFPLTWHIIKDIPNRHFQNITLENNDNNVVTFSRDTQEIGLLQGLMMLKIFKCYPLGTSILDDFDFYENKKSLRNLKSTLASPPLEVESIDKESLGSTSTKYEFFYEAQEIYVKYLLGTLTNCSISTLIGTESSIPFSFRKLNKISITIWFPNFWEVVLFVQTCLQTVDIVLRDTEIIMNL
ncbi:uncharacterized protein [Typha angustifolia]